MMLPRYGTSWRTVRFTNGLSWEVCSLRGQNGDNFEVNALFGEKDSSVRFGLRSTAVACPFGRATEGFGFDHENPLVKEREDPQ
jgi:hypothetical protein